MKNKLNSGIGVNDYRNCEKYILLTWKHMLSRCYNPKVQAKYPTYIGCSVDSSWRKLSDFRAWFLQSNYKPGLHLDKDIINRGNKVYGPSNCSFVSGRINNLIIDSGASRGQYSVGVYFNKLAGKFKALCGINGKQKYIGLFTSETDAFNAYKSVKESYIKVVAEEEYQLGNCTKEAKDALLGWTI